ncbi:MAG: hypothetical protein WBM08_11780 [Prochlorococcaceae cyanobacterium]
MSGHSQPAFSALMAAGQQLRGTGSQASLRRHQASGPGEFKAEPLVGLGSWGNERRPSFGLSGVN